jgi:Asp-tRNA(Asn)/Glu-tRNA(Gln) amidotransferase A subunit family amidase
VKIGILQESEHIPYSLSVVRALSETEANLRQLGYEIVPFILTKEVWDQARDIAVAAFVNGYPGVVEELKESCEELTKDIEQKLMIQEMGVCKRWLLDKMLRIAGQERIAHTLTSVRKMTP